MFTSLNLSKYYFLISVSYFFLFWFQMLVMVSVGGVFVTWLATLCLEKPCMCSIAVTHATFSQLYCKLPRPLRVMSHQKINHLTGPTWK